MQGFSVNTSRSFRESGRGEAPETAGRRKRRRAATALTAALSGPLPPLVPYKRCACGVCRACHENAKWDRIFAKFEVKEDAKTRGFCRSPITDL